MIRNIRQMIRVTLPVLCAVALLLPLCAGAELPSRTAHAPRSTAAQTAPTPIDYANPASEATVELSASALIALLTGESVSAPEATYVDGMLAGGAFRYHNAIPPSRVETAYDDNTLHITAHVYTYTTEAGETVTWIPTAYTLAGDEYAGDLTLDASSGTYKATLADVPESSGALLEVSYTCRLTVKGTEADGYLNYAYRYASRLHGEKVAYEQALEAYEAYRAYLAEKEAYDTAARAYEAYLAALATYEKKHAAYLTYEQDMARYREDKAAYDAYLSARAAYERDRAAYETAYAAHLSETNAYLAKKDVYDAYMTELGVVLDCMATVDNVFVHNSEGKQMYATLMGDTVATVVANKELLISTAGCDARDIDTAARSTGVLQDLLSEYKGLTERADKLAHYKTHYPELKDNFISLYGALRSLYNNDTVKTILKREGKLERYIEFLSQLYVISTGLDDSQTRSSDWYVYGRYNEKTDALNVHTILTELEEVQRPTDRNNANPAGLTCPATVAEPTPPKPFTATPPVPPPAVNEPSEPDPVIKPEKPAEVAKPTPPTPVADPGPKPVEPAYTATGQALLAAYAKGELTERPVRDVPLDFSTTVTRRLSLHNKRPVEFYDADGKTLLFATELDDGDAITYPHDLPIRADSASHTYRFAGWKDDAGHLISTGADLGVVDERHEVFYASYEATLRRYEVTWRIGETDTVTTHDYGTIPACPTTPEKTATAQYTYAFRGWRVPGGADGSTEDLVAVVGPVTYEAVFEPILRSYTVTWQWHGDSFSETLPFGTEPVCNRDTSRPEDERFLYTFAGWDTPPAPVVGDATYTARYDATPILTTDTGEEALLLTTDGDTYRAPVPPAGLRVDRLLALALLRDRDIVLTAADESIALLCNEAMIADLASAGCTYIHLLAEPDGENPRFTARFTDANGGAVTLTYPVTLQLRTATPYTRAYSVSADGTSTPMPFTYADGHLTIKLAGGGTVLFRDEYALTLSPMENGMLSADTLLSPAGATVRLTLTHADDFRPVSILAVGLSGAAYPVTDDLTFTMPSEPVTVTATVERITYRIRFEVEGQIISDKVYYKGEAVEVPTDPQKAPQGEVVYTFSGWTPAVGAAGGDVTYKAVFTAAVQGDNDLYIPPDSKNREYIILIEGGLLLLLLVAAIALPIVLVKRKRRKKKQGHRA